MGAIQINELTYQLSVLINELESQNYNLDNIDFFLKIYDAINKSSAKILL